MLSKEVKTYLISFTTKQKSLIRTACDRGITVPDKELQDQLALRDPHALGGVIGTIMQKCVDGQSIIKVINRDDKGSNVYGINEDMTTRDEIKEFLDYIESY